MNSWKVTTSLLGVKVGERSLTTARCFAGHTTGPRVIGRRYSALRGAQARLPAAASIGAVAFYIVIFKAVASAKSASRPMVYMESFRAVFRRFLAIRRITKANVTRVPVPAVICKA